MGTRARQNNPGETPFLRAGAPPPAAEPATSNPGVKLLLLLLGAALLSLSFAPIKQFYLAAFGLVPWLLVLNACKTRGKALLWSWLAGVFFFAANMWWLVFVTIPGAIALMVILGLYWAAAGWLILGTGLLPGPTGWSIGTAASTTVEEKPRRTSLRNHPALRPLLSMFGIAIAWVAISEWLRATWPFGGLPWLFLGYTQTPAVITCQIADITGVYGVSFCVALVNAWVALFIINRLSTRHLRPAGAVVLALLLCVLGYGWYRLGQKTIYPGPTVMVVQSNYPQSNTGKKGATARQRVDFHETSAIRALDRANGHVDLVVWSETMMPPLNAEILDIYGHEPFDQDLAQGQPGVDLVELDQWLRESAAKYNTAFLVGAEYVGDYRRRPGGLFYPTDVRNSAYFYDREGRQSDVRYDKIHRVPFGEYIPFKESVPPLYHLLISLGPPDMENYQLHAGDPSHATVFSLRRSTASTVTTQASSVQATVPPPEPWRFVSPICFEDIDGPLVAWMFRAAPGSVGMSNELPAFAPKQADFIVNLTNDGWFKANEMPQHLQAAVFRSIENRAPTARSVNTGISGFIDSLGRIDPDNLIPAGTEGSKIATLQLDHRTTFYTHWGDLFADICAAAASVMAVVAIVRWRIGRKRQS